MARPPRTHFNGAVYHVMSRGNKGENIFLRDDDWRLFLDFLSEEKRQSRFRLFAYCLMSNHFHLLLQVGERSTATIMQHLLSRFALYTNALRQEVGHVFQGRYKAILCHDDIYFLTLLRYIHRNPVRAELVCDPAAWPWSSHRAYLGLTQDPLVDADFPLSLFSEKTAAARSLYKEFVLQEQPEERLNALELPAPIAGLTGSKSQNPMIALKLTPANGKPMPKILAEVEKQRQITSELILSKNRLRPIACARQEFIMECLNNGHLPTEIARFLHCALPMISYCIKRNRRQNSAG